MSIGAGIALFVIGAILTFALHFQVGGVDINLIGQILMGAGVVVFLLGLIFVFRGRSARTTVSSVDPASGQAVSTEKRTTTNGL